MYGQRGARGPSDVQFTALLTDTAAYASRIREQFRMSACVCVYHADRYRYVHSRTV